MNILRKEKMQCPCCMEEHDVQTISVQESNIFKDVSVEYTAEYRYCDRADETYEDDRQISLNDIAMKNAYREKMGLLTSSQIAAIRAKYGMSQRDLCLLLGWGGKTLTRYESHQVQDIAHDTILRKIDSDSEWFLNLLRSKKDSFSPSAYAKYAEVGAALFERSHDLYLTSAIMSKYARFLNNSDITGGKVLSLDVVADMIRYYANSTIVTNLFLVKLLKMLWYADVLSYKRRGVAISGMIYLALPMGAVPLAYELIIDLSKIHYEEIEIGDGTGYKFSPTENKEYPNLTPDDKIILDTIIKRFGKTSKKDIVKTMHQEDAYTKTSPHDIILFKHAKTLSVA